MRRVFGKTPASLGGTSISCRAGVVRIVSPAVFSSSGTHWRVFLERIGRLPEIDAVDVDRVCGTAAIYFSCHAIPIEQILKRLSAALAGPGENAPVPPLSNISDVLASRPHFRLFRRGEHSFSTWQIVHDTSGRLRVRDVDLRTSPAIAQRIRTELGVTPGISDIAVGSLTGSVLIRYDAKVVHRETILTRLDELVGAGGMTVCQALPKAARWLFANASLGVAAAGALVYTPLLPVSAILLVAASLLTFREAWRQIRRRHAGLPVLHAAIVGATLATGGFLPASLMNWLLLYWEDRRARLTAAGQQMLSRSVRPPARAWVVRDGVELATPLTSLHPGDVVTVRAGETIPGDGRIVSGMALLDEDAVRGLAGFVFRSIGDAACAGAFVVDGELRVELQRAGEATLAATVARTLALAASRAANAAALSAPRFAEQAVPSILMTAGVGLVVGDAAVAAAVLRPDYATGPGLGDLLALIDRLGTCFDQGIIVRRPEVLDQVADADIVLFDHDRLLEVRLLQVAAVHVAVGFSADEVLAYAACAARQVDDPRARAVRAADAARQRAPLHWPVTYLANAVEFADGSRTIRITGLEGAADAPQSSPFFVFSNGELAGSVVFREGRVCAAAAAILELRDRCGMQVELLSSAPAAEAEQFAAALGTDGVHLCPSDESREAVIFGLRARGHRVMYVGDCRQNPRAAVAAQVAVFPCPDPTWESDPSGVWLLTPHFEKLTALRDTAVAMRDQTRRHCAQVLIPNLACIAGAFLFGFSSLAVVLLSNLGTYSVYSRSRAALRRSERLLLARRRTPRPLVPGTLK